MIAVSMEDGVKTAFFQRQENKRLNSGCLTLKTSSYVRCAVFCLTTNGCVAASVTTADDIMLCSLATNLTGQDDLVEDAGSYIFVKDPYLQGKKSKSNLIKSMIVDRDYLILSNNEINCTKTRIKMKSWSFIRWTNMEFS